MKCVTRQFAFESLHLTAHRRLQCLHCTCSHTIHVSHVTLDRRCIHAWCEMKTKAVNWACLSKSSIRCVSLEIYDILCWIIVWIIVCNRKLAIQLTEIRHICYQNMWSFFNGKRCKWFGVFNFYSINRIIRLSDIQLSGIYCIIIV